MAFDEADYEIDFDEVVGTDQKTNSGASDDEEPEPEPESSEKKVDNKHSDLTSINYEEEWMAERRRHEVTKERLFLQDGDIIKLKARIEKLENTPAPSVRKTSTAPVSGDKALLERIANLEEELRFSLGAAEDIRALKSKSINLVERLRVEKQEKARAGADVRTMAKKVDMLSVHIEKLMVHLKHEAAAKIKAVDALRGSERRCNSLYDKNALLTRKVAATDRLVLELREGSKILEDQLRLMDEKYLELRTKLDYSRGQAAKRVEIAEKKATSLRVKYALLGNSKLLDTVDQPMSESQDINDPATNSPGFDQHQIIHRGSMKKRRGTAVPKVKRINMNPGFSTTDKDKQEEAVIDKIRRNRGKQTVWTEEKLRNLTKTST
jgi:hypothetical protein